MTIYKYPLLLNETQLVPMPHGARVISVGLDLDRILCVWAEVDKIALEDPRRIVILGTGTLMPPRSYIDSRMRFIGTVAVPKEYVVCHVYEELENAL